jgi:phosphoribosylanthranilate isomerase
MEPVAHPRVKICCISSAEEASLAVRYGASSLGLVSAMPSGPGVIPDNLIAEIAATVPPGVATFLLTSAQDAETIIAQQRHAGVNTLPASEAGSNKASHPARNAGQASSTRSSFHPRSAPKPIGR